MLLFTSRSLLSQELLLVKRAASSIPSRQMLPMAPSRLALAPKYASSPLPSTSPKTRTIFNFTDIKGIRFVNTTSSDAAGFYKPAPGSPIPEFDDFILLELGQLALIMRAIEGSLGREIPQILLHFYYINSSIRIFI